MSVKELLLKTLTAFNLLEKDTRKETYRNMLRYIDVFNAVFQNTRAELNIETITIEFTTNKA